ncbi:MAG: aminotransferase class I/II-fold pyridoxal phosphate-dependent enzyme [Bacteroidetes bacterium]|nr:aminotransferase class I/II-fold pyridoxal phosphate-dependent enzyme [Bacteroidota bacterium]MBS1641018.1 aminotransferase class I/II-fold pyridoxal phosphate-dependent enzyme [Bacteroidota bacterium]MBS1672074.1 aminotransferase class I/II-fold pyridoxal phosphate-dependent enzyme [Bacteroidota bacterium]
MIALHSKLPEVGTTIFTTMSSLAITHKAINLGQGFPDFLMSKELIALVNDAMQKGKNQYTHMAGYALLRERIAEKCNVLYNSNINAETEITITPGGTYAIYTALTTILEKDDEVIVFEPCYDSYIPNIEINGAKAICISLQYPHYTIPWNEVKEKINTKTKAIIINSPHNPTGAVLKEKDIIALKEIVANTNIIIVSDEVYEHLVFDGMQHQSILRHADLMERSFVCFSFGKTYHCTGWKIGYCIASATLMKEFRKVHQFNCFSCNTPQQYALAEYILHKDAYTELGNIMQQKRDYLRALMKETPFSCIPSHGSYFECYSYNFTNETDKDLAIRLTKEFGVATIPVSAFYMNDTDNKVLRFCFAKQETTLEKAAEQLRKIK